MSALQSSKVSDLVNFKSFLVQSHHVRGITEDAVTHVLIVVIKWSNVVALVVSILIMTGLVNTIFGYLNLSFA